MILSSNLNNTIIFNHELHKKHNQESLFNAVNNGDQKLLKELLSMEIDLNCKNSDGNNLLILAARKEKKEIVQQLIDAKIDLNAQDARGFTSLAWSTMLSKTEITEMLINAGADLNIKDSTGCSPFIWAARLGKKEIVDSFIKAKPDVNIQDNLNRTALHWAAERGHTEIVEILLLMDAQDQNSDCSFEKSLLYKLKAFRKKNHKKIFNIISKDVKLLENFKECALIKSITHSTHQAGNVPLEPLSKEKISLSIPAEGGKSFFWLNKMRKATELMHEIHATILSEKEKDVLTKTLEFGSNIPTYTHTEILNRIQQDLPVILSTGYKGHTVSILIWGSHFILCNRGESSRAPIEVFQYDKEKLNEKTLESILNSIVKTKEDYQKLFFETLPQELNFKQDELEKTFQKECSLLDQTVGNCSWISPETTVWALLVLQKVRENKQPNIKEIVKKENKRFESWAVFNQLYHLERYMNVRHLRKPSVKEKKSVRTSYKTNTQIIEQGFANSRKMFKNKMIDPGVLKERNELYKYFKTSGVL